MMTNSDNDIYDFMITMKYMDSELHPKNEWDQYWNTFHLG